MKTSLLTIVLACAIGLTNCKVSEDKSSVWDSKRAEIEAITAHYSDINPYGSVNWSAFEGHLGDDKVVEHFDIDLYRQCLDMTTAVSREKELLMKEYGCKTLYDQYFHSIPDNELEAFNKRHAETFAKCDSIQKSFEPQSEKAMVPCMEWGRKIELARQGNK